MRDRYVRQHRQRDRHHYSRALSGRGHHERSCDDVAPGQVRLRVIAAGGGSLRYLWFHRDAPDAPEKLIGVAPTMNIEYAEGAIFSVRV
jgi:hypothetical protein